MPLPQQFEILSQALPERASQRFAVAVQGLRLGLERQSIRKVDLDDAKRALGLAFEKAWEREVAAPFFHAGRFEEQPEEIRSLYWAMSASSLHAAISMQKRLDKAGLHGPVPEAMQRVLAEAVPLAEAAAELKPLVVKGRAPNPDPAPAKEHKNGTGTCSCCFSGIAITDAGRVAHHGYRRPGWGVQTSSCEGVRFPPLEVSTEGLEWLIGARQRELDRTGSRIESLPALDVIHWKQRTRTGDMDRVSRSGDPDWDRVKASYARDLEYRRDALTRDVAFLQEELGRWAGRQPIPEPADHDSEQSPEP